MAKQADFVNICIRMDRQPDGTYLKKISAIEAHASDPAGATDFDKISRPVPKIVLPAYAGTDTCDAMATACLNAVKTAAGVA